MDNQGLIDELKLLIKQGREEILTTKKVVEGVIGARPTVNNPVCRIFIRHGGMRD